MVKLCIIMFNNIIIDFSLFLLLTAGLVTLAACYENIWENKLVTTDSNNNKLISDSDSPRNKYDKIHAMRSNLPSVINDHIQVHPPSPNKEFKKPSELALLERLVRCFSVKNNCKCILSTHLPQTAVPTINAFKSIGCFLILNFHLIWFSYYTVNNAAEVFVLGEQLKWQWLSTAPLIVDIFFAIRYTNPHSKYLFALFFNSFYLKWTFIGI